MNYINPIKLTKIYHFGQEKNYNIKLNFRIPVIKTFFAFSRIIRLALQKDDFHLPIM